MGVININCHDKGKYGLAQVAVPTEFPSMGRKMITLERILLSLKHDIFEVNVDQEIAARARPRSDAGNFTGF